LLPVLLLGSLQLIRKSVPELVRKRIYFASAVMILIWRSGHALECRDRWPTLSKSLRGIMGYKLEFAGVEGWMMGVILLSLPFVILTVLVKLFLQSACPRAAMCLIRLPQV